MKTRDDDDDDEEDEDDNYDDDDDDDAHIKRIKPAPATKWGYFNLVIIFC